MEGLNLDLVGAYLWAGDAVSVDGNNDEDPYEFGAQPEPQLLSLFPEQLRN